MSAIQNNGHSVNIAGRLIVNGQNLAVGQICQNSLVLQEPCNLPPSVAQLIVTVAGIDKVYDIFLPDGIDRNAESVHFF
jgi:hypothetical protein